MFAPTLAVHVLVLTHASSSSHRCTAYATAITANKFIQIPIYQVTLTLTPTSTLTLMIGLDRPLQASLEAQRSARASAPATGASSTDQFAERRAIHFRLHRRSGNNLANDRDVEFVGSVLELHAKSDYMGHL